MVVIGRNHDRAIACCARGTGTTLRVFAYSGLPWARARTGECKWAGGGNLTTNAAAGSASVEPRALLSLTGAAERIFVLGRESGRSPLHSPTRHWICRADLALAERTRLLYVYFIATHVSKIAYVLPTCTTGCATWNEGPLADCRSLQLGPGPALAFQPTFGGIVIATR